MHHALRYGPSHAPEQQDDAFSGVGSLHGCNVGRLHRCKPLRPEMDAHPHRSASVSSAMPNAVLAPVPLLTITSRALSDRRSISMVSGPLA